MAFEDAIAEDMAGFDGLQTVTITHREDDSTSAVPKALLRQIGVKQAEASNGQYTTDDVICNVRGSAISTTPRVGDSLTDASGKVWVILATHRATLGSRWRLILRDLAISETTVTLDTLIDIEVATWSKGDGGAQEATWGTFQENVRAHIQDNGGSAGVENGQRRVEARYTIFCEEQFIVGSDHRVIDSDGSIYRVTGYANSDRIDKLYEIHAEPW